MFCVESVCLRCAFVDSIGEENPYRLAWLPRGGGGVILAGVHIPVYSLVIPCKVGKVCC